MFFSYPKYNIPIPKHGRHVSLLLLISPTVSRRTQRPTRICPWAVRRQSWRNIRPFPVSSSMFVRMSLLLDHHALLLSGPSLDAPSSSQPRATWIRMGQLQVLPRLLWWLLLPTTRTNGRRNLSCALHVP